VWQKKYLIVSDLHTPFHDLPLYKAIIKFAVENGITDLVLNGDILDFFMISKYPKIVNGTHRKLDLQSEIDEFISLMIYTRKIFKGHIYFVRGNHEQRLEKFLASKAPEISNLRSLDLRELCSFQRFDIIYVPKWLVIPAPPNILVIYHGIFTGENSSKRELLRHNCNLICGHTHKTSFYEATSYFGKVTCWHTGSLADKSLIDENCKYSEYSYQSQSFAILSVNKEYFNVEIVNCSSCDFIYGGKVYEKIY